MKKLWQQGSSTAEEMDVAAKTRVQWREVVCWLVQGLSAVKSMGDCWAKSCFLHISDCGVATKLATCIPTLICRSTSAVEEFLSSSS